MMRSQKVKTWAVCACLAGAENVLQAGQLAGCGKADTPKREELSAEESTDINVTLLTSVLECEDAVSEKIWASLKAEGVKDLDMVGIDGNTLYVTESDGTEYIVELSETNEVVKVTKA